MRERGEEALVENIVNIAMAEKVVQNMWTVGRSEVGLKQPISSMQRIYSSGFCREGGCTNVGVLLENPVSNSHVSSRYTEVPAK